jgi:hypothetical protein
VAYVGNKKSFWMPLSCGACGLQDVIRMFPDFFLYILSAFSRYFILSISKWFPSDLINESSDSAIVGSICKSPMFSASQVKLVIFL